MDHWAQDSWAAGPKYRTDEPMGNSVTQPVKVEFRKNAQNY